VRSGITVERGVSALGSDGNSDTAPSRTEGVAFPIHVLALNAMGVHLLDYLQFEDLVERCEEARRWEFLITAAPLANPARHGITAQPNCDLLTSSTAGMTWVVRYGWRASALRT
jgi:hypothetical protein